MITQISMSILLLHQELLYKIVRVTLRGNFLALFSMPCDQGVKRGMWTFTNEEMENLQQIHQLYR